MKSNGPKNENTRDPKVATRDARAQLYFEDDLKGLRQWYSDKASVLKRLSQALSLFIIAAGAAIAFVGVFADASWVPIAAGLLGALVVVAKGWERIARYDETWMAYRIASERMKRERRLYVNSAGRYEEISDEDESFRRFIEAVEQIIAEEQQIYFREQDSSTGRRRHEKAEGLKRSVAQ